MTTELQAAAAEIAEQENELLKLLEETSTFRERTKVNKLREALGFYESEYNYDSDSQCHTCGFIADSPVAHDYGKRARKALEETADDLSETKSGE